MSHERHQFFILGLGLFMIAALVVAMSGCGPRVVHTVHIAPIDTADTGS